MTVYFRKCGEVPDGSITEQKLADLSVSTEKLKNQAVTLAKAHAAVNLHHFTGDETEVSVEGTTETEKKTFKIVKASDQTKGFQPSTLHINAEVKTSDAAKEGSLKIYVDEEGTPRITVTTTSTSYEMKEGEADISDLATGSHIVKMKLVNADAAGTTYNDLLEIFMEK